MWLINLFFLSWKQLRRGFVKSILTIFGVATGMFLFLTISAAQESLQKTTKLQANDDTLVVYRDKRFCPFTSKLPFDYGEKIKSIPNVKLVTPIKVVVSNCGTSLDTVCFRGIPKEQAQEFLGDIKIISGDFTKWLYSSDTALIGESLANRRGLKVGDKFDAAGITVSIAGIISSTNPQDMNVAYVQLDFLQRSSHHGLGIVTQFNVKVNEHQNLNAVAKAIDSLFRYARDPTHTRPEKAFVAQIAKDMVELITFTYWISLAAVFAVVTLVMNTVIITVRSRVKENAIFRALGFLPLHLFWITICEAIILSFFGSLLGILATILTINLGSFTISSEGVSLFIRLNSQLYIQALYIALGIGFVAGVYPAILAAKGSIVDSLRKA